MIRQQNFRPNLSDRKELSFESELVVKKAARSITELQPAVSNVTDVMLFLELLGYDNKRAQLHGFATFHDLAVEVYNNYSYFDEHRVPEIEKRNRHFQNSIPPLKQRIVEGVSLIAPWIGVLALLYLTGFSLWMSKALPADITIAFIGGVFIGLIASEGMLISFNRIFSFHYSQGNLVEARRTILRLYCFSCLAIGVLSYLLFIGAVIFSIPPSLVVITIFGLSTIALHRVSYLLLFSTRKLRQILLSYSIALAVFYFLFTALEPDTLSENTDRYFVSFLISFLVLCIIPAYYHYTLFTSKTLNHSSKEPLPNFYTPRTTSSSTVKSNFGIQIWENLPHLIFGTFYFIVLFGDRVVSWFFTPAVLIATNGIPLPLIFNSAYHVGADLALFTIIPVAIYQFTVFSPLYTIIGNMSISIKIGETSQITNLIRATHKRMITISLILGCASAVLLNLLGPSIIYYLGGNEITINILRVASIGNIALGLFAGNTSILIFLNRTLPLAIITIISAIILLSLGMYFGNYGYGQIVYAYLIATTFAAAISCRYTFKTVANSASILLAKFS